jgi:hypothetical protein
MLISARAARPALPRGFVVGDGEASVVQAHGAHPPRTVPRAIAANSAAWERFNSLPWAPGSCFCSAWCGRLRAWRRSPDRLRGAWLLGASARAGGAAGKGPVALFVAAVASLVAFVAIELRRTTPMLEMRLFTHAPFMASMTGALFTGLAVIGLMSYSPTVMQGALHVSVLGSAALLATWSATSMGVALGARSLPSRLTTQTRLAVGLVWRAWARRP